MQRNKLKDIWASGQPVLVGWCSIGNPFTAEIMAGQGYDAINIDVQHGALDYAALLPMLQAVRATGVTPLARVPWLEPGIIMKALDAGAMGIICPMVNNRADAEALVSYMRYPPLGQRSFGPTRAAVADPGYGVEANGEVLAMAMIETADGVRNLEEICATPGLDGVYVGPADPHPRHPAGAPAARPRPRGAGDDRDHPPHRRRLPGQRHQGGHPLRHARNTRSAPSSGAMSGPRSRPIRGCSPPPQAPRSPNGAAWSGGTAPR